MTIATLKQKLQVGARLRFLPFKGVYQVLEVKERGVVICDVMPDGLLLSHKSLDEWVFLEIYSNTHGQGIEIL
jgi:hypothetical protein